MARIFSSGFENGATGCGFPNLTDAGAWNDYGPAGTCAASPPIASIVTSGALVDTKSLRVHFKNGDGSNGPDFRIVRYFDGDKAFTFIRWRQKWDANWRWSPGADHKTFITGPQPEDQNVYFNLRGNPGGASAYAAIHVIPEDVVFKGDIDVSPGEDITFELGVKWGPGGWVRGRIGGVLLNLTVEAGGAVDPENCNPGSGGGYVKWDTTYNDFAYFEANVSGGASNTYLDAVAVDDEDWVDVGEEAPGGSPGSPDSPGEEASPGDESPGGGGGGGGSPTGIPPTIYSDIDLQDPGDYYGGFKEARVTKWGIAERAFSDPWTGAWTGATFDFETSDFDRSQRIIGQNEPHRYRRTRCVRMTNRPNRANRGIPWVVWIGPCIDAQPVGKLGFKYTLGDRVAQAVVDEKGDKHQIPWRLMRDGFMDQLDEIAETFDYDQPEPIIYGHHLRVPDVDGPSGEGFELTPPLLGKRTIGGVQYYVWLIAGHACSDVPRIRIETFTGSPAIREMVETPEGTDWLIPTHANHTAIIGASYEDYTSSTFGVLRRYTLLYGVVGDGTTPPDEVARGDRAMTVAVTGRETNGDGTGEPIIDRFQCYEHFLINEVANRADNCYHSGPYLANPTYTDPFDGARPVVEEESFDECSAIALERFPVNGDGYQGSAAIGCRPGDRRPAPDWMAVWNRSCGGRFGWTHLGAMRYKLLHPTEAIKAAAPLYTDATEIGLDTFSCSFTWADLANVIPFRTDYEHISGQWKTNDVYTHDPSVEQYGAIPSALREYQFAPGITPATHLAILEARVRANPPRLIGLETVVGPDEDGDSLGYRDLGDYIRYRHFASVGDSIGEIRLAWIVAHQVQVSTRTVRVVALDCEDLIGFDAPNPDVLSPGGSPSP